MENLYSQEKANVVPQNLQKLLLKGKKAEVLRLVENKSKQIVDYFTLIVVFMKAED